MSNTDNVQRQLYDRQLYVWGAEAQRRVGQCDALIVGLGGAGCCIAKNLLLTGVRSVTLLDERPVIWEDLATNFFATEADVGIPRAAAISGKLGELNRFACVEVATGGVSTTANGQIVLELSDLRKYAVVIFCDYPTSSLTEIDGKLRAEGVKFVACELRGVTGCVFVDGGDTFTVVDKNAEDCVSCVVLAASPDGVVLCHDDKKHECEVGDMVYFTGIREPQEMNTTDPASPRLFKVLDVTGPCALKLDLSGVEGLKAFKSGGGYLHTTKQPMTVRFKSLRDSMSAPEFLFIDDEDISAASMLHATYTAAHEVMNEKGDVTNVDAITAKVYSQGYNAEVVEKILRTFGGKLGPLACVVGAMASQEALKLVSFKFMPLMQWFYWDARQLLSLTSDSACETYNFGNRNLTPEANRYAGLTKVMGRQWVSDVQHRSAFIVGAGALGCELIKNLALLGIGTAGKSDVVLTDMDTIELSNLSRQFLFRQSHIGHFKSAVAADAARTINPALRVTALQQKIAAETEGIFNEAFWESRDVILNALDNVPSRKYVDSQCLAYKKPLFESGTLGAKCNTQTVVPHLTESYGVSFDSTYDPPEESYALCTIKNFPHAIEHTVHWAREMFGDCFVVPPRDFRAFATDPAAFVAALAADPAQRGAVVRGVAGLRVDRPRSAGDCVVWARKKFTALFDHNIRQLLHNVPLEKVDDRGNRFWSGAKKPPTPLTFDDSNEHHLAFVRFAAVLFGEMFGMSQSVKDLSEDDIRGFCRRTPVEQFHPKTMKFALSEKDVSQDSMEAAADALPPHDEVKVIDVVALEFEKDDDNNHHIDFITAASNLRAINYGIPPIDRHKTKLIAGKIIPAMVTTTSLATGLVCVEMCKYLLGCKQRSSYRNAFVNVAAPLMAFNEPQPTPSRTYVLKEKEREVSITWTIWDRLDVDEGKDVSLQELVQLLESRYGLDIMMMTLTSGKMIYNSFARKRERMAKRVREVIQEVSPEIHGDYISVIVAANIGDAEADVPLLRYKFRNF